jgi:hypothetical protein
MCQMKAKNRPRPENRALPDTDADRPTKRPGMFARVRFAAGVSTMTATYDIRFVFPSWRPETGRPGTRKNSFAKRG